MAFCTNCGKENPAGTRFCGNCGSGQDTSQASCPTCGNALEENEKFCSSCGAAVNSAPHSASPKEAEIPKGKYTKEGRKIIDAGPKLNQHWYTPPPQPPASSAGKKKKRGLAGCLLTTLIVIAIVVVAAIFIVNSATDWFKDLTSNTELTSFENSDSSAADKPQKSQDWTDKKVKTKTRSTLITQNVNTDSVAVIASEKDISVLLPAGMFEGDEKLEVKELDPIKLPDGRNCEKVLDISLGKIHEFDDYAEIRIDPPATFNRANGNVQCYTQKGNNWQQIIARYDSQQDKIVAYTSHFSMFAFTFETFDLVHDPMMIVADESYKLWGRLTSTAQTRLLDGYDPAKIMAQQNDDYLVACWSSAMELYGLEAAGLSFAENVLEMSQLSDFNNIVGDLGFGLALVNAAMEAQKGNKDKAVLETLKNAYNYAAGKIMNSRALNIAFIGVFAIDYSLTAFANEAIEGRKRLYRAVFDNFNSYQRRTGGKKLIWWKKEIYWRMEDAKDASKFEEVVEKLIREYTDDFWESSVERAIIQAELQNHGWTFDGGINEKMKKELNAEFRIYILQYIQPLIERMQNNYLLKARDEMKENAARFASMLNQEYELKCRLDLDEKTDPADYKGSEIVFEAGTNEMKKLWRGVLNEDATMDFDCTYAGYLDAGLPSKATLFIPLDDKGEEFDEITQSFTLNTGQKSTAVIFQVEKELADGPWEISEYEASELYNFMNEIVNLALGDEEAKKQAEETNAAKRRSAVRTIEEEYKRSKELGSVNAPAAKYEPGEELLYLFQFNPEKENGLYTFTINEEDCDTRVLLDLKSKDYFEAKSFTVCKGFVWIDYFKGNLKKQ